MSGRVWALVRRQSDPTAVRAVGKIRNRNRSSARRPRHLLLRPASGICYRTFHTEAEYSKADTAGIVATVPITCLHRRHCCHRSHHVPTPQL